TSTRLADLQAYCRRKGYPCLAISAATNKGLSDLITYVGKQVDLFRKVSCETSS
ncbi:MAG: GTPase ObgE, partial [Nitrospira sp. WS238]|nr:GTPase ObgE [Nitrospira sp. WS238]